MLAAEIRTLAGSNARRMAEEEVCRSWNGHERSMVEEAAEGVELDDRLVKVAVVVEFARKVGLIAVIP